MCLSILVCGILSLSVIIAGEEECRCGFVVMIVVVARLMVVLRVLIIRGEVKSAVPP
jgi:hypothetical protein